MAKVDWNEFLDGMGTAGRRAPEAQPQTQENFFDTLMQGLASNQNEPIKWADGHDTVDNSGNHWAWTALKQGTNSALTAGVDTAAALASLWGETGYDPQIEEAREYIAANNPEMLSAFDQSVAAGKAKKRETAANIADPIHRFAQNTVRTDYVNNNGPTSLAGEIVKGAIENAPQLALTAGAGILTGGLGAGAMMGSQIMGSAYGQARDSGASGGAAAKAALLDTMYQMPLENLGFNTILGKSAGLKKLVRKIKDVKQLNALKQLVNSFATEGATEFIQQYGDSAVDEMARAIDAGGLGEIDPNNIDWEEATKEALMAGAVGGTLGVAGTGARMGINKARGRDIDGSFKNANSEAPAQNTEAPQAALTQEVPQTVQDTAEAPNAAVNSDYAGAPIGNMLLNNGYSRNAVAGILGNLQQESAFNTGAISSDGHNSLGIAQWTAERRDALEAYAAEKGTDPTDLATQVEFLQRELDEDPELKARLMEAKSPEEAAEIFHDGFERSADREEDAKEGVTTRMDRRRNYARDAYDALGGGEPAPPSAPPVTISKTTP